MYILETAEFHRGELKRLDAEKFDDETTEDFMYIALVQAKQELADLIDISLDRYRELNDRTADEMLADWFGLR